MGEYPYLPEQPNEQSKTNALINALLGFGNAIVQPSPSRSANPKGGLHKLLNALPGAISAGVGNYGGTMRGDYDLVQKYLDSLQNREYKQSYIEYHDILKKKAESDMEQQKLKAQFEANEQKRLSDILKSPFGTVDTYNEKEVIDLLNNDVNLIKRTYQKDNPNASSDDVNKIVQQAEDSTMGLYKKQHPPVSQTLEEAIINGDEKAVRRLAVATMRTGDKSGLKGILSLMPEGSTPKDASDARIYAEYILSGDPQKKAIAEGMITYKRTQPPEAGAIKTAQRQAEIATAAPLKAEEEKGKGVITPIDKKKNAQRQVTSTLDNLFELYVQFDEMGASVSTDRSAMKNVMNWAGATGAGQTAGKMFGTEAQSVRNKINQSRPLLLNYIRQASEMGARGLDSEKELEFYLQAATDPARDIEANLAAIAVLDEAYGEASVTGESKFRTNLKKLKNDFKKLDKKTPNKVGRFKVEEIK